MKFCGCICFAHKQNWQRQKIRKALNRGHWLGVILCFAPALPSIHNDKVRPWRWGFIINKINNSKCYSCTFFIFIKTTSWVKQKEVSLFIITNALLFSVFFFVFSFIFPSSLAYELIRSKNVERYHCRQSGQRCWREQNADGTLNVGILRIRNKIQTKQKICCHKTDAIISWLFLV